MSVEVRAASEADCAALIRLNQAVQRHHAELYPGDFKREVDPSAIMTGRKYPLPRYLIRLPIVRAWPKSSLQGARLRDSRQRDSKRVVNDCPPRCVRRAAAV